MEFGEGYSMQMMEMQEPETRRLDEGEEK